MQDKRIYLPGSTETLGGSKLGQLRTSAPDLDAYIRAELFDGGALCPVCGSGSIIAGTVAGERFGVCMSCYNRALRRAVDARARDVESNKAYQVARKRASKAGFSMRDVEVTGDDIRAKDEKARYEG